MPDNLGVPDWVSEPAAVGQRDEAPALRRSDLRRAAEEQRRRAAHRAARGRSAQHASRRRGDRPVAAPRPSDPPVREFGTAESWSVESTTVESSSAEYRPDARPLTAPPPVERWEPEAPAVQVPSVDAWVSQSRSAESPMTGALQVQRVQPEVPAVPTVDAWAQQPRRADRWDSAPQNAPGVLPSRDRSEGRQPEPEPERLEREPERLEREREPEPERLERTRADARRREPARGPRGPHPRGATARGTHARVAKTPSAKPRPRVELVPPSSRAAARAGRTPAPRERTPVRVFARRRLVATLGLTAAMAVAFWSLWPSGESSPPGRSAADVGAALTKVAADPQPAVEDYTEAPDTTVSAEVVASGTGRQNVVALPAIAAPTVNPSRTVRVGFKVEGGLGVDAKEVADVISSTLGDTRGWQTRDRVRFRAVTPEATTAGELDITIVLASPELTDKLCAPLKTRGQVSCFNERRVVLNSRRWLLGVSGYEGNLAAYRQYLVNHEIGHGLFHGHVECPGKGKVAPIMLQQTKGLDGCKANAWPTVG